MSELFDYIKSVNNKSAYLLEDEDDVKTYPAFMVNRGLSMHNDTVFFANEMNKYPIDGDIQYRFHYEIIPKGNRFGKWLGKPAVNSDAEMLKSFFHINTERAEEYLQFFSEEQLKDLRKRFDHGGKQGKRC